MTETGFGALLRRHRIAAKLTQEALAERAGLSTRGISDLERGARELPRKDTLQLLLHTLDLSPADRAALIAAARRDPARAPRSERADRLTGLPVPLTPLIGRETEVAAVSALLAEPAVRLLTLSGPGGTGKTRLALAVAERVASDVPDGVTFAPLAALADPSLVASAIAHQLGVREAVGQTVTGALTTHLRDKRLLLILDSFEHLLSAAPLVTELLGGCRSLKIMVTSRVRLRLSGEREVLVPPLTLPSRASLHAGEEIAVVPSVRLFVARAQDVKADFALTDENAPVVGEICQRLDGLPLALELAAARVKILPPAALLARLDRRLPLLTGGAQDLPDRQQTLRKTIAWSHELLSEEERILFRRLGVFAGGWTLEAAEAVANGDGGLDVFEGLTSLVDKSLVRQADEAGDMPRFTMLETIREFALEQLNEHPADEQVVRRAHAAFFANQALAARGDLSAGVPAAVRWVRAEEANLRGMLTCVLDAGDAETALRVLGGSLSEYWTVSGGQFTEARAWLDRAWRQGERTGATPAARAWALYGRTILALHQGDRGEARRSATEGLALARMADDSVLAAQSLFALTFVEESDNRMEMAQPLVIEAVAAARAAWAPDVLGWTLMALGRHRLHAGDLDGAILTLEEALALFRGCGGAWGACDTLNALSWVTRARGDLAGAARLLADALRLRRDSGLLADVYIELLGVIELARIMGHPEAAARLLGAEVSYCTSLGYVGVQGGFVLSQEVTRQALVEQLGDSPFRRARDAGSGLSIEDAIDEALVLADELGRVVM
jgi:predicted ATPase/DNA-binding XRE family transcriptional regulator